MPIFSGWQHNVKQDEIDVLSSSELNRALRSARGDNLVPACFQVDADQLQVAWLIVYRRIRRDLRRPLG